MGLVLVGTWLGIILILRAKHTQVGEDGEDEFCAE